MVLGKDNTFYDFSRESFYVLVFGSYTLVRKPRIFYFINVIGSAIVAFLYLYGVLAGMYTMLFLVEDKSLMVQVFYGTGLIMVSLGIHTGRILTDSSLHLTRDLIRSEIFIYNDGFLENYRAIKRKDIKQMKFLVSFIMNGMFFCAFNNTIIGPLMQLFFGGENFDEEIGLNLYLPFLIYVPFNTRNITGFVLAYTLSAFIMFTMYGSFACHEELFMCTYLQLSTEMKVLSYSLKNMEKRALFVLKKKYPASEHLTVETLYDNPRFQECLCECLKENILHHHAILRFRNAMRPYVETTATVVLLFFSLLMAAAIVIMLQNTRPQLTLITDIFGFLPMCWVGQILANESAETKHFLFDTPWPDCNENFKTLLKTFLLNVQRPIILRAKGLNIEICLETFADMVSVGYKVMNVMR